MLCKELKLSLSSYVDNAISLPARIALDEHLGKCPVCRAELSELRALKRRLEVLSKPTPPADLIFELSNAIAIEAAAKRQRPNVSFSYRLARFLEPRLMPYTVGWIASIFLFAMMFLALRPHFVALREASVQNTVILLDTIGAGYDLTKPVKPEDFAASRAPFAEQSPSLNPGGALAALTRTYARPRPNFSESNDDMVVVADVFSNGAASLAGVVQPPRDKQMLDEFERALRQDAAFVPASMDRRPETMRVVFAVQKVDVDDRKF